MLKSAKVGELEVEGLLVLLGCSLLPFGEAVSDIDMHLIEPGLEIVYQHLELVQVWLCEGRFAEQLHHVDVCLPAGHIHLGTSPIRHSLIIWRIVSI